MAIKRVEPIQPQSPAVFQLLMYHFPRLSNQLPLICQFLGVHLLFFPDPSDSVTHLLGNEYVPGQPISYLRGDKRFKDMQLQRLREEPLHDMCMQSLSVILPESLVSVITLYNVDAVAIFIDALSSVQLVGTSNYQKRMMLETECVQVCPCQTGDRVYVIDEMGRGYQGGLTAQNLTLQQFESRLPSIKQTVSVGRMKAFVRNGHPNRYTRPEEKRCVGKLTIKQMNRLSRVIFMRCVMSETRMLLIDPRILSRDVSLFRKISSDRASFVRCVFDGVSETTMPVFTNASYQVQNMWHNVAAENHLNYSSLNRAVVLADQLNESHVAPSRRRFMVKSHNKTTYAPISIQYIPTDIELDVLSREIWPS